MLHFLLRQGSEGQVISHGDPSEEMAEMGNSSGKATGRPYQQLL